MEGHVPQADVADVEFARTLYFTTMPGMIESQFGWDQRQQEQSFASWFDVREAGIIVADGCDVGWMQSRTNDREIFLGSLFILPES